MGHKLAQNTKKHTHILCHKINAVCFTKWKEKRRKKKRKFFFYKFNRRSHRSSQYAIYLVKWYVVRLTTLIPVEGRSPFFFSLNLSCSYEYLLYITHSLRSLLLHRPWERYVHTHIQMKCNEFSIYNIKSPRMTSLCKPIFAPKECYNNKKKTTKQQFRIAIIAQWKQMVNSNQELFKNCNHSDADIDIR